MALSAARDALGYAGTFARFPFALARFLHPPLTLDEARRIVASRFARREAQFLAIVRTSVFENPGSPYRALLRLAGCERGDVERLVRQEGLESALAALRRSGVYVTFEELRGRVPIVRGSTTLDVHADDFNSRPTRAAFHLTTGGSTGHAMAVNQDLENIAAVSTVHMLMLDAWGVLDVPVVYWMPMLPGGGLRFMLQRARFGGKSRAWFSQFGWLDSASRLKYDFATLYGVFWMKALGYGAPIPRSAGRKDALRVARLVRRALDEHGRCLVYAGVSAALRIALAAGEAGLDLAGATLRVGGEPVTAAKVSAIARAGARVLPTYGAVETGAIGLGCPNPGEPDHVHLASDLVALITFPYSIETGETVQAFNLTSLLESSPKVLINYQIDDYGMMEQRACGCALHAAGYTTSLHTIRSYSKVLSDSVTFSVIDIQPILERTLPARLGGTPLDYQLLEEEATNGVSRVRLVISPRVPIAGADEPVRVFLDAVRQSSARGAATAAMWEQAGTVSLLRAEPVATARGKQPVVVRRRPGDAGVRT
jgi:hypothetical protein